MTTTTRRTTKQVQDEYEQETGERPTRAAARVILDQEADSATHR